MIANSREDRSRPVAVLSQPLEIGGIAIRNRVLLAPMSGVSDLPFRRLAVEAGAGLVFSEMVASEQLASAKTRRSCAPRQPGPCRMSCNWPAVRRAGWRTERGRQSGGRRYHRHQYGLSGEEGDDGYSGSALMRDLDHALTLIDATAAATRLPVTLKMRLGWDERSINAPEIARAPKTPAFRRSPCMAGRAASSITAMPIGRRLSAVKAEIYVPHIVNGDIVDVEDAERALALSGADAVMIGRASYGRPWLPGAIARAAANGSPVSAPEAAETADIAERHYRAMIEHYGLSVGLRAARKHLAGTWIGFSRAACRRPHARGDDDRPTRTTWSAF